MTTAYSGEGEVINVTATAGCTKGTIWAGTEVAGVFLATYAAASTNTAVPVAVEGVFTVTKKAAATLDFAVGEMAYVLATGGVNVAVATGGTIPIGYAIEAATTTATTVRVKLSR